MSLILIYMFPFVVQDFLHKILNCQKSVNVIFTHDITV